MALFLFISCQQEEIIEFNDQTSVELQKSLKIKLSDEELINQIKELKIGTKRAYIKYNKKYPNNDFNKRFGKPILNEIKYIQFVDDENITMIVPLTKKKDKKRKLLASYYKNGKKTYKVFTNKKYKRNESESVFESNLLNNLDLFFKTSKNKNYQSKAGAYEEYLYSSGCWDVYQVHEDGFSYRSYRNTCPDEKGDSEINDEWDEPADPDTPDDTGDVTDYCDSGDPTCDDGTGGSTGSDGDNTTSGDQIIFDSLFENSIAGCVYENLQVESGDYKNIIKRFDGEFPVSHLKFSLSNTLPNNTNAITIPPSQYVIEIKLNGNNLNRPVLSIARTIIHETLHAEMFRKLMSILNNGGDLDGLTKSQLNSMLSNGDFPGVFDYYTRFGVNGFQHEQMAAHYIDTMASILMEYDNGNSNIQFYKDLSWVGLKNTTVWNDKPYSEKLRINNVISNFNLNSDKNCEQ